MNAIKIILLSLFTLAIIAVLLIAFDFIAFADPDPGNECPVAVLPDKHDICHINTRVKAPKDKKEAKIRWGRKAYASHSFEITSYDTSKTRITKKNEKVIRDELGDWKIITTIQNEEDKLISHKEELFKGREKIKEGYIRTFISNDKTGITKKTEIEIENELGDLKIITTVQNNKGKLILHREQNFKGNLLVEEIKDGVVRTIISGDTHCDFKVIEPPGDTISFRLDPENKPKWQSSSKCEHITFSSNSKIPKKLNKDKYESIIGNRWNSIIDYTRDFGHSGLDFEPKGRPCDIAFADNPISDNGRPVDVLPDKHDISQIDTRINAPKVPKKVNDKGDKHIADMNAPRFHEIIRYDTSEIGGITKKIEKSITDEFHKVYLSITIQEYNNEGKLMSHREQRFENGLLVEEIENGVVRTIISGDTRCDFKVIEPSGDTIFIRLDPKNKPKWQSSSKCEHITFSSHLKITKKLTIEKYADIIGNRWRGICN